MGFEIDVPSDFDDAYPGDFDASTGDTPLYRSAPDMLAALKLALPHVQRVAAQAPTTGGRMARKRDAVRAEEKIRAAIAKAEGRR